MIIENKYDLDARKCGKGRLFTLNFTIFSIILYYKSPFKKAENQVLH